MPDDWNDRIRSSNDYLNRRSDQLDFERIQADTRDAVYDGIVDGDDFATRRALGIPGDRFADHLDDLLRALETSHLPNAARWADRLRGMECTPEAQPALHEFATAYDRFYQVARHISGHDLELEKDRIVSAVRALWKMVGGE